MLFLGILLIIISNLFGRYRRYAMGGGSPIDVAPIFRSYWMQIIGVVLNNGLLLGGFVLVFRSSIPAGFILLFIWLLLKLTKSL